MVVYAGEHVHGHRVWKLHCAGLGLGPWWFESLRVQRGAACDTGHRHKGSVWLRAWQVLDTLPSHPPTQRSPEAAPVGWCAGSVAVGGRGGGSGRRLRDGRSSRQIQTPSARLTPPPPPVALIPRP